MDLIDATELDFKFNQIVKIVLAYLIVPLAA
jgi:hypothetical protein